MLKRHCLHRKAEGETCIYVAPEKVDTTLDAVSSKVAIAEQSLTNFIWWLRPCDFVAPLSDPSTITRNERGQGSSQCLRIKQLRKCVCASLRRLAISRLQL